MFSSKSCSELRLYRDSYASRNHNTNKTIEAMWDYESFSNYWRKEKFSKKTSSIISDHACDKLVEEWIHWDKIQDYLKDNEQYQNKYKLTEEKVKNMVF